MRLAPRTPASDAFHASDAFNEVESLPTRSHLLTHVTPVPFKLWTRHALHIKGAI